MKDRTAEKNKKYGALELLYEVPERSFLRTDSPKPIILWLCRCSCGKLTLQELYRVKAGHVKSCGCSRGLEYHLESDISDLYATYKYSATKRGYEFSLTKKEFRNIVISCCAYCTNSGDFRKSRAVNSKRGSKLNGVDRKDSTKGYFLDNCLPCCKRCNLMKGSLSSLEFIEQCRLVAKHTKRINTTMKMRATDLAIEEQKAHE